MILFFRLKETSESCQPERIENTDGDIATQTHTQTQTQTQTDDTDTLLPILSLHLSLSLSPHIENPGLLCHERNSAVRLHITTHSGNLIQNRSEQSRFATKTKKRVSDEQKSAL